MEAENQFVRQLEAFLGSNFDDYGRRRVLGYLADYRKEIEAYEPPEKVLRHIDTIRYTTPCSDKVMDEQARLLCIELGIDYDIFRKPPNGKSAEDYISARKSYCKAMVSGFLVSRKRLQDYFNVDHASISYYVNGRDYKNIRKQLGKTA